MIPPTALLLAAVIAGSASETRAAALFVHALRNNSSAPEYVLVTVRSPGQPDRIVCTPAPFLLGALRTELGPGQDPAVFAEARSETRTFELRVPKALENVAPAYSPQVLAEVQRQLSGHGPEKLREALRSPDSALHRLYQGRHGGEWQAYRDAVAHVLLVQGVPVGHGDPAGNLYLPAVELD